MIYCPCWVQVFLPAFSLAHFCGYLGVSVVLGVYGVYGLVFLQTTYLHSVLMSDNQQHAYIQV